MYFACFNDLCTAQGFLATCCQQTLGDKVKQRVNAGFSTWLVLGVVLHCTARQLIASGLIMASGHCSRSAP